MGEVHKIHLEIMVVTRGSCFNILALLVFYVNIDEPNLMIPPSHPDTSYMY